jgi:DNA polymerase-1
MGFKFIEHELDEVVAGFSKFDTCAVDLETSGLNPHDSRILLCQVGFPGTQYVIDARKVNLSPLLPFLASNNWMKIFFGGKFDIQFFLKFYGEKVRVRNIFDCYIAERVLFPEKKGGQSFEDLALTYLGVQLNKEVRKSFIGKGNTPFTEDQIKYAAEDVDYLFPLMESRKGALNERKQYHIAQLEFDLVPTVASMELTGVPVDKEKWRGILNEYATEQSQVRENLLGVFHQVEPETLSSQLGMFDQPDNSTPADKKVLNLGSPAQVKAAFANLGVHVKNTSDRVIQLVPHPAARLLTQYRKLDKIRTSYGEASFLDRVHPFTGRIHADWHQVGTETGRFACSKPNLQQMPAKFRSCVVTTGDDVLLWSDFSQMELRILAQESKDPVLMEAFLSGRDIHTATASVMFGVDFDKVTKEQRYTAKTLNFGITYGMGIGKFADIIKIETKKEVTQQQAIALMDRYKETYKVASEWLKQQGFKALRDGVVSTRFGRQRIFQPASTKLGPDAYKAQIGAIKREGANTPIQGGNADITKMAMISLYDDLQEYGYKGNVVLQVHDELVILAHKNQVENIKPIVEQAMINAGQQLLPDVPIVVDTNVDTYWRK